VVVYFLINSIAMFSQRRIVLTGKGLVPLYDSLYVWKVPGQGGPKQGRPIRIRLERPTFICSKYVFLI